MVVSLATVLMFGIPVYLRKVGMDWLLKRRDVGILILLFSKIVWWFLVFLLLVQWWNLHPAWLLSATGAGMAYRVYRERFIYRIRRPV